MTRVKITVPDPVMAAARAAGLDVSVVASAAIEAELERHAKAAALDARLDELEAAQGPITPENTAAAEAWADQVVSGGAASVASQEGPPGQGSPEG